MTAHLDSLFTARGIPYTNRDAKMTRSSSVVKQTADLAAAFAAVSPAVVREMCDAVFSVEQLKETVRRARERDRP